MSRSGSRTLGSSVWATIAALALQGCGGGGGGGGGDSTGTPSGPDRNAALKLDSSNFGAVSAQGLRSAEMTLKVAQHATLEVARLARGGALQTTFMCLNGTARSTLVDADGNGVPSAGDTVKIDYARCSLPYFGDAEYNGTLSIKLNSVDDALTGAVAGTLDFGAGLVSLDGGLTTWLGTLNFRSMTTVLQERLEVSATAADDLRRLVRVAGSGPTQQTEAYQHPQVVRVLQRDTARASVSGSVSLASGTLGGRIDIAIDSPLSAYLDTHADTGSVRIGGASNTRITLRASASGSSAMQADLDSNGDGVTDSTSALDWNNFFTGYVFSEQSAPTAIGFLASRNDQFLSLRSMPTFTQLQGTDVSAPLRLQFSRPLAAGSVLYARLVDHGEPLATLYGVGNNALSDAWPIVETDVEINGAVILLRPHGGLRYGHNYQVLVSNIGDFEHAQAVTLRSASGLAEINLNVQITFFNSDDMLWAAVSGAGNRSVVMPGLVTTLSATVPRATSLPLRYQWTQLSGPSLVLGSPTSASTAVRLADGSAPGISIAELQLTVTDAIGRRSIAPVQMQVANLAGAIQQLYFASGSSNSVDTGETYVYSDQTGTFLTDTTRGYLTVTYLEANNAAYWNLQLSDASGGVPAAGSYAGAVPFGGLTSNIPRFDFFGRGISSRDATRCAGSTTFRVLDIAVDTLGVVQRLAVDFGQTCRDSNTSAPLHGSVRINSSLPITP